MATITKYVEVGKEIVIELDTEDVSEAFGSLDGDEKLECIKEHFSFDEDSMFSLVNEMLNEGEYDALINLMIDGLNNEDRLIEILQDCENVSAEVIKRLLDEDEDLYKSVIGSDTKEERKSTTRETTLPAEIANLSQAQLNALVTIAREKGIID